MTDLVTGPTFVSTRFTESYRFRKAVGGQEVGLDPADTLTKTGTASPYTAPFTVQQPTHPPPPPTRRLCEMVLKWVYGRQETQQLEETDDKTWRTRGKGVAGVRQLGWGLDYTPCFGVPRRRRGCRSRGCAACAPPGLAHLSLIAEGFAPPCRGEERRCGVRGEWLCCTPS